ncbi:MAG: hypothetical protein JOZ87_17045 [Chloroflexi bacterium]|nr:hypothetical protein [Chloroflexota bacterium]
MLPSCRQASLVIVGQAAPRVDTDGATPGDDHVQQREELVDRLSSAVVAMLDMVTVYMGMQLGLHRALPDHGLATWRELVI